MLGLAEPTKEGCKSSVCEMNSRRFIMIILGDDIVAIRTTFALAAFTAALISMLPVSVDAAGKVIRARFSYDAIATCTQPPVQNFSVHAEGTGTLSTDRTATLDMSSSALGTENYSAKLGGRPTEAPGGSASLRVVGRNTLRAVRDYPNNQIIAYMTVIGNTCSLRIENRLKPGKRDYTFYGNLGVFTCAKPQVIRAVCAPD